MATQWHRIIVTDKDYKTGNTNRDYEISTDVEYWDKNVVGKDTFI
jgi:hypothetical protein